MRVVITAYNQALWVGQAVQSVLNQTARPVAIVAVDDGSRDATAEVLARYASAGVHVLSGANAGVCAARNRGASLHLGDALDEFVVFLDGDDLLEPTFVARTLAALRRRPRAAFAYTGFRRFGAVEGGHPSLPYWAAILPLGNVIANAALIRRSAFAAVGGYDPRWNRRGWEDWALYLALAELGHRGVLVDAPLLRVRVLAHQVAQRNRMAEADPTLAADILAAYPRWQPAGPLAPLAWYAGKLWRRAWLAARAGR